jgi:hypothetical protein
MTINEDTGEDVLCPICESPEFGECGHLVADFDRTYCECNGGEIFERQNEFIAIVEQAFLPHLQAGTSPALSSPELEELWNTAELHSLEDEPYVALDGYVFQHVLIETLLESGAIEPEGSVIDPGGPGMTSAVSLLFSENPDDCIEKAMDSIRANLGKH